MNSYPYEGEVRLLRWGESSTAGRTITLELPPDAGEVHPFKGFPVGTKTGQRFRMRFAVILDDETTPAEEPPNVCPRELEAPARVPSSDRSDRAREQYAMKDKMAQAATRAAMLCRDEEFQDWLSEAHHALWSATMHAPHGRDQYAIRALRSLLQVQSRSQISSDERAYEAFLALETSFKQATGQFAEAR